MSPTATAPQTVPTKLQAAQEAAGAAHAEQNAASREIVEAERLLKGHQDSLETLKVKQTKAGGMSGFRAIEDQVSAAQREIELTVRFIKARKQEADAAGRRAMEIEADIRKLQARADDIKNAGLRATRDLIEQRRRKSAEISQMLTACGDQVRQAEQMLADLLREYTELTGETIQ